MLNIVSSKATSKNEQFIEIKRKRGQDNLRWLDNPLKKQPDGFHLILLGGVSSSDFRLRVAQSHLRHDLSPSHWSHVLMLDPIAKNPGETRVYEISLQPPNGFGYPPPENAVQSNTLAHYRNAKEFPNIAIIHVPVSREDVMKALTQFKQQRVLDATELLVLWLSFAWGVGRSGNPLLDGRGIPSAAMIEAVIGGAGYDLTPGLESRSSCPEAIWQAVRWWHQYYKDVEKEPLAGAWHAEHFLVD